jgi:quercetin dioxygenase-like cupin family protein
MSFALVSSLTRKSNSSTRINGTAPPFRGGRGRAYALPMARVHRAEDADPVEAAPGVECRLLVAAERGSELALDVLSLETSAALDVTDAVHDTLLFVHAGSGALDAEPLAGPSCALLPTGRAGTLTGGPHGLECVRATLGAATDLHAPMGATEPVVALDDVESGAATGARSFQVLHGPHNGCTRATLFVGYIPPGRAPWHYHLYDEIVWVLRGEGRLHIGDDVEELGPGAAFRLHPREVHIVENTHPSAELAVLGVFTPAGSPSAAYLMPDVAETYVISG